MPPPVQYYAALLICMFSRPSVATYSREVQAGSLFFTTIDAYERNPSYSKESEGESLDISVLLRGGQLPPPWLMIDRSNETSSPWPIVLYGTPCFEDIGVLNLEVWSTRNRSNRKLVGAFQIRISQPPDRIYNVVKFPLVGMTAYRLFVSERISTLVSLTKRIFGTKWLLVRVNPLHSTSGLEVSITPGRGVSALTRTAREEVDNMIGCCQTAGKRCNLKAAELFTAAGFDVDWCSVQQLQIVERQGPLHSLRRRNTLGLQTTAASNDSFVTPPSYEGSNAPLVVIVIVAATVTVLVTTGLAWVFFGGRSKGFYISHKRALEQRILRETDKQNVSNVARAQKVLLELGQGKEPSSLDRAVIQSATNIEEIITDDSESIPNLPNEPLPPYSYPRGLLRFQPTVTSV